MEEGGREGRTEGGDDGGREERRRKGWRIREDGGRSSWSVQGCHSLRLKCPLWEEVGEHSEDKLAEVAQVRCLPSHGQVGVAAMLQEHSLLNSLHTRTPRYWVGGGQTRWLKCKEFQCSVLARNSKLSGSKV